MVEITTNDVFCSIKLFSIETEYNSSLNHIKENPLV
jgi:hypothetical protein